MSDFVFKSPEVDHEADMEQHGAGTGSTKLVYWIMGALLVLLFVLLSVALHKPAGE